MRAMLGRAVVVGLLSAGGLGAVAAPAQAECVQVDFEIRYPDGTTWSPPGGPHYCVTPTPWEVVVELGVENNPDEGDVAGFWVHVAVPVP